MAKATRMMATNARRRVKTRRACLRAANVFRGPAISAISSAITWPLCRTPSSPGRAFLVKYGARSLEVLRNLEGRQSCVRQSGNSCRSGPARHQFAQRIDANQTMRAVCARKSCRRPRSARCWRSRNSGAIASTPSTERRQQDCGGIEANHAPSVPRLTSGRFGGYGRGGGSPPPGGGPQAGAGRLRAPHGRRPHNPALRCAGPDQRAGQAVLLGRAVDRPRGRRPRRDGRPGRGLVVAGARRRAHVGVRLARRPLHHPPLVDRPPPLAEIDDRLSATFGGLVVPEPTGSQDCQIPHGPDPRRESLWFNRPRAPRRTGGRLACSISFRRSPTSSSDPTSWR